jgi:hypothetical protein
MTRVRNPEWGAAGVSAAHYAVQPVPDAEANWCDGRLSRDVEVLVRTPEPQLGVLEEDDPVEVKAAAYRVVDGTTTRRGRFKIRRDSHQRLRDESGVYVAGVYNPNSEPRASAFLAVEFVAPDVVDDAVDGAWGWDAQEEREVATIAWSSVLEATPLSAAGEWEHEYGTARISRCARNSNGVLRTPHRPATGVSRLVSPVLLYSTGSAKTYAKNVSENWY